MTTEETEGERLVAAEMARQHRDAAASVAANGEMAARVAASVRRTGRLALLGMGGSHWVDRTAMFAYRDLGIEVQAEVVSEVLSVPLPGGPRTVVVASQSGGSGEIGVFLDTPPRGEERFGLTLNPDGALARRLPSLLGAGGVEVAYAATRSILVSQALHVAVLAALGADVDAALLALERPANQVGPDLGEVRARFVSADAVILSGRRELQGVAESCALFAMELARLPVLALEGGQFRHGPMEVLGPKVGTVILRPPGPAGASAAALAAAVREAGGPTVVFDLSGASPVPDCVTIPLPEVQGMAAAITALPQVQAFLVGIAAARVPGMGTPLRSSKVTTTL